MNRATAMKAFVLLAGMFIMPVACRASAATAELERQGAVTGRLLTSRGFPAGNITFGEGLEYIGSDLFVLYGVARCEIYLFGESDEEGRIKRLYWVQFEGYLPDNDHTYDYSGSERKTQIGGRTFHDDVWFYDLDEASKNWRDGSDSRHVLKLLADAGYEAGPEMMGIRLVHLDDARRNELMIIYQEDLSEHGLSVTDLDEGGGRVGEWEAISKKMRARALAGMSLSFR